MDINCMVIHGFSEHLWLDCKILTCEIMRINGAQRSLFAARVIDSSSLLNTLCIAALMRAVFGEGEQQMEADTWFNNDESPQFGVTQSKPEFEHSPKRT